MPDSDAGNWAAIGGAEFINAQRTIAYVKNFGLPLNIDEGCWCSTIQDLVGCDAVTGYLEPSTPSSPAPWYSSGIPESADFLGFLPIEFEGLGGTYERSTYDLIAGGAVLGRLRAKPRTFTWKGYLIGRTCCAAEYGLRWLTAELANAAGCDQCDGAELDVMLCCPAATGVASNSCTSVENPALGRIPNDDAFRAFMKVGLVDGPHRLNVRRLGCGGDCLDGPGCLIEIEFSLVAGNPFMHRQPVTVCDTKFPPCPGALCVDFVKTLNDMCPEPSCITVADCTDDPGCPQSILPTFEAFEDTCRCDPLDVQTIYCTIDKDIAGEFFEAVPTIEIFSGDRPMRNIQIRFYENPQERLCTDPELTTVCNMCDEIFIRFIPKNTTLTINGTERRLTASCPGGESQPAERLASSSFTWPVLRCINYCVRIDADCAGSRDAHGNDLGGGISPGNSVKVSITPREM